MVGHRPRKLSRADVEAVDLAVLRRLAWWAIDRGSCQGRLIGERAVRSLVVVVGSPSVELTPGVGKTGEPTSVQALLPQASVEAFYESVLSRLARLNELLA